MIVHMWFFRYSPATRTPSHGFWHTDSFHNLSLPIRTGVNHGDNDPLRVKVETTLFIRTEVNHGVRKRPAMAFGTLILMLFPEWLHAHWPLAVAYVFPALRHCATGSRATGVPQGRYLKEWFSRYCPATQRKRVRIKRAPSTHMGDCVRTGPVVT